MLASRLDDWLTGTERLWATVRNRPYMSILVGSVGCSGPPVLHYPKETLVSIVWEAQLRIVIHVVFSFSSNFKAHLYLKQSSPDHHPALLEENSALAPLTIQQHRHHPSAHQPWWLTPAHPHSPGATNSAAFPVGSAAPCRAPTNRCVLPPWRSSAQSRGRCRASASEYPEMQMSRQKPHEIRSTMCTVTIE